MRKPYNTLNPGGQMEESTLIFSEHKIVEPCQ